MIHRILVLVSFVLCGFVLISFTLFARDQLAGASEHQQSELVAGVPTSPGVTPITHKHGQPRATIDKVADALTSPFRSIVQSNSEWVLHGVPTFFALLVYGVGLGYLARFSSGFS